jgi:S1/P1 Nuclease
MRWLTLVAFSPLVSAWGMLGHRTVAYIAYGLSSPETQQLVDTILDYEGDGRDVSDGAIWPDQIRHARPWTGAWHFIDALDNPPHHCEVSYPADCGVGNEGCIVSALRNQTLAFIDPETTDLARQEALKFVLHFVGDLHQPLHDENLLRGGNGIPACWHNACARVNLHSVWDTLIPDQIVGLRTRASYQEIKDGAAKWAKLLTGQEAMDMTKECVNVEEPEKCAVEWAREVNAFNCLYVLKNGTSYFDGRDLSTDYYDGAKPIVEYLIGKAGVRLATWLEAMIAEHKKQLSMKLRQHVVHTLEF